MTNDICNAAEKYLFTANKVEQVEREFKQARLCMESAEDELLNLLSEKGMQGSMTVIINRLYGVQINGLGTITAHAKKVDLVDFSKPVNSDPHYKDLELDLS